MASLVIRNGWYYAQFYDAQRTPDRKRHALKTKSRKAAQRLCDSAEDAYRLGRFDPWIDTLATLDERPAVVVSVGQAVAAFLAGTERTLRPQTLGTYRSVLRRLEGHAGAQTPLARLAAADVEPLVCDGDLKPSTQRKHLRIARTFFRWAIAEGHIRNNPAAKLRPDPEPARVPRAITEGELLAVCAAIVADYGRQRALPFPTCREGDLIWMVPAFVFAFYTGMRASEIARLRWSHVDFGQRLITVEVQKNKKAQTIPLSRKAAAVLEGLERLGPHDYVFQQPLYYSEERNPVNTVGRLGKTFSRYRRAAGIMRPLTFHSLRHGFCTALAEAGKSAWVIREAARHASVTTSQRYVSLANEYLKAEIDSAFG